MKSALQLCSQALNPSSPQPTAGMVKVFDGAMWSYGGTACVRVPVPHVIGAAFNPKSVLPFFRKERKKFSVTVAKGKLVLSEGKEKLSTRCLPPDEMVVLDVFGEPQDCSLDMRNLKLAASVVDSSNARLSAQGVQFRNGLVEATDNKRLVQGCSGLPAGFTFNLPLESAKILLKFPANCVAVYGDRSAVKFMLDDGSSLCSNLICEDLPDLSHLFAEQTWTPLDIPGKVWADLYDIPCDYVVISNGSAFYVFENARSEIDSSGELTGITKKDIRFRVRKDFLNTLLQVSGDIRINGSGALLQAAGETCRCICGTTQMPK